MDPILLALLSAIFLGLTAPIFKMAVQSKPHPFNAFIAFLTAAILMWAFIFLTNKPLPSVESMPFYIIAGVFAPGLASLVNFESFKRVGVSLTASLVATAPFFAIIFAILFLKEQLNLLIGLGTLLIISGVVLLSWFRPKKNIKLSDLSFALIGAFMIGIATVITKLGLNLSNVPYSGMAVAVTAGVIFQLFFIIILKKWNTLAGNFHEAKYFLLSGVFITIALFLLMLALATGEVIVVFPINQTQALFAILFSYLLLRKLDHITKFTVVGAIIIVIGSSLVGLGA